MSRPIPPPFYGAGICLAEMSCCMCPAIGATIVAFGTTERAYCGPVCAGLDGWPWLVAERPKARRIDR